MLKPTTVLVRRWILRTSCGKYTSHRSTPCFILLGTGEAKPSPCYCNPVYFLSPSFPYHSSHWQPCFLWDISDSQEPSYSVTLPSSIAILVMYCVVVVNIICSFYRFASCHLFSFAIVKPSIFYYLILFGRFLRYRHIVRSFYCSSALSHSLPNCFGYYLWYPSTLLSKLRNLPSDPLKISLPHIQLCILF